MLPCFAAALAVAGELVVTVTTPVVIRVDDTVLDYVPGTMSAQVSGLSGIHEVKLTTMRGAVLERRNVGVPRDGVTHLLYDGRSLAVTSGGVGAPPPAPPAVARPAPAGPKPKAKPAPVAMDAATFDALLEAVEDGAFSEDKVGAVRTAAASHWFTIAQVGALIDQASFSEDKVEIARICQPKVVDPGNAFALGEHFPFSDDREAVLALFR